MSDVPTLIQKYRDAMVRFETLQGSDALDYIDAMVAMKTAADACRDAGVPERELFEIRRRFFTHAEFMTDER